MYIPLPLLFQSLLLPAYLYSDRFFPIHFWLSLQPLDKLCVSLPILSAFTMPTSTSFAMPAATSFAVPAPTSFTGTSSTVCNLPATDSAGCNSQHSGSRAYGKQSHNRCGLSSDCHDGNHASSNRFSRTGYRTATGSGT